jgi:DNA mismatch repair protein MutL
MPEIRQLSPSVINKIAAGEVIERPASVVKELMENSVDAGALRVDVTVAQGGTESIRIVDNGCGIRPDQMMMAIASHATSKIEDAEDLFNVETLGFRGEALASIAEVSQMTVRSCADGATEGAELEINGGKAEPVKPCGCPVGTSIEVRNLFFNTPVRRRFMKANQTEMGHITEAFTRLALVHPNVHFKLQHNGRVTQDLPSADNWKDRIAHFYGKDLADALIWVESEEEGIRLSGFVADPVFNRSHTRMQYLFLNGRHIRDRSLQHALGEAYRGLLLNGRYPIAFLKLDMPAHLVDVNVHPTKLEVRFQDARKLYSQLLSTIRNKFLSTDLTARVHEHSERADAAGTPAASAERPQNLGLSYPRSDVSSIGATNQYSGSGAGQFPGVTPAIPADNYRLPESFQRALDTSNLPANTERLDVNPAAADVPAQLPISTLGLQVHNRYLVTQDESGMLVIDQHALHERVLYEQLREKVLAGELETQRLLVPEPVSMSGPEAAVAVEHKELFEQIGIEVEPFGGDTILVSSYPAMLRRVRPAELIRQLIDEIMVGEKQPDRRDVLDELMHMMSCKAAVKAGDPLTPEEIHSLLMQRHLFHDTHHCPHGRPTALVFTRDELDRRFERT